MIGALVGDIVGSRFEFRNSKSKDFDLFTDLSVATDDSVMTLAVASALMRNYREKIDLGEAAVEEMQRFGRLYPDAGYGGMFVGWLESDDPRPYNSFGNGAAMRVSPVGWEARNEDEVREWSQTVTAVTHNHPEGLRGAESVAMAIYLLRQGMNKEQLKARIEKDYGYDLSKTVDEIRPTYSFDVTCQGTVPQAFAAFFDGADFEDVIRNAVSLGGDSDTIAAIAGSIAQPFFGVPDDIRVSTCARLDEFQRKVLNDFEHFI